MQFFKVTEIARIEVPVRRSTRSRVPLFLFTYANGKIGLGSSEFPRSTFRKS